MLIILVARDDHQLPVHLNVRSYLMQARPDLDVLIYCGERDPRRWRDEDFIINVFEDFAVFENAYGATAAEKIAHSMAASPCLPNTLFRSDPRFVYGETPEHVIALEQLYLEQKARELYARDHPDIVVVGAAGHLVWTVLNLVANHLNIVSYRLFFAACWNPGYRGMRYWYTRSIYANLSDDPRDQMEWPRDAVGHHVDALLTSIENQSYRLDQMARATTRKLFISSDVKSFVQDLRNGLRYDNKRAKVRLRSVKNAFLNNLLATAPADLPKPFFLFPLNMPADEQLTLRAPQFRDIFSTCQQIANVLPYGYFLVIKEHPSHPGMLNHRQLKGLLRAFPSIRYVSVETPIHTLLGEASALVSVNSTAAIDALVRGKPVITLGEAFYRGTGLTHDVGYFFNAHQAFAEAILDSNAGNRRETLVRVLSRLIQETHPGPGIQEAQQEEDYHRCIAEGLIMRIDRIAQGSPSEMSVVQ